MPPLQRRNNMVKYTRKFNTELTMAIMRKLVVPITLLAILSTFMVVFAVAEEGTTSGDVSFDNTSSGPVSYTITFTRGYTFINPLNGTESDHLFTGKVPEALTVEEGESFVFPENTIKFSDYEFVCWKYSYKDTDGKTITEKFNPGDTYENVSSDMTIAAVWKRPPKKSLVITGFISYLKGDEYAEGEDIAPYTVTYGDTIKLKACPYTKDGYDFAGWVDSDGVLYRKDDSYTVNKANPVLTAVWQKNGESILTHKVIYKGGEGNVTGKGPGEMEMYNKTTFKVAKNTFVREGYEFLYWVDENGSIRRPGETVDVSSFNKDTIILTAVWKEIINYYTITFNIQGEGDVSPSGSTTVAEGASYAFTVNPYTGYRIKSVRINGVSQEIMSAYIIENISENTNVDIIFEKIPTYEINITSSTGGAAYVSGDITRVLEGDDLTIYLTPNEGYYIKALYINGEAKTFADNKVVIKNITGDQNIVVEFAKLSDYSQPTSSENTSAPIEVKPPEDMQYIYILAALIVLMTLGFIVFKIKK